jgi:NADP-dependent 3-hydroxy acid dehydrogenase YdfG
MEFSDYRTALVTGASSGIGAATVRRLRTEGLEVHALARDAHRLAELSAETGCRVCAIDVNDLEALTRLATLAEFDVLINNAGGRGAAISWILHGTMSIRSLTSICARSCI